MLGAMHTITIGELSKFTGVKIPTIRYYEETGLLPKPERSEGNQRRYSSKGLELLAFISHARELGLTIEAIRELIELSQHPERPCAEADRIADEQLAIVQEKIAKLRKLEAELLRITSHDHANQVRDCYVIQALANHDLCCDDHD